MRRRGLGLDLLAGQRDTVHDVERIRARSPELFASDSGSVPVRRNVVVWE